MAVHRDFIEASGILVRQPYHRWLNSVKKIQFLAVAKANDPRLPGYVNLANRHETLAKVKRSQEILPKFERDEYDSWSYHYT